MRPNMPVSLVSLLLTVSLAGSATLFAQGGISPPDHRKVIRAFDRAKFASGAGPAEHVVLHHPFDVRKYILELEPDLSRAYLVGTTTIECTSAVDNLDQVLLNFVGNWGITGATVDGSMALWYHDGEVLTVSLPTPKNSGDRFSIRISYRGYPNSESPEGNWYEPFYMDGRYGHTMSQPFQARYWFPCFDEPSDKAEEGCETIVRVPRGMQAAGNGLLVSAREEGGRIVYHWRHVYPIATYLISVAVGSYTVMEWSAQGVPIPIYVYPDAVSNATYDFNRLPLMMDIYAGVFGRYPFEKYGTVMIPARGHAMEHQTMTHFSDRLVTGDRRYEYITAHELAHQWWGDSLTCADYREIWLNESFATYSEITWWEGLAGPAAREQVIESLRRQYLEEDAEDRFSIYRNDYRMDRMFSATTYEKGALVLLMLRWELGDTVFYDGLREYYRRHAYGTVTTADFTAVMESVSGRELDGFFQGWIYGTGYPEYEISSYYTSIDGRQKAIVTVRQAQNDPTVFAMSLPVDPDGAGPLPPRRLWIDEKWERFEIDASEKGGPAEIVSSTWLLMTTAGGDYPEPNIKGVRNKRVRAGESSSLTVVGSDFTPVSRVLLSSKDINVDSLEINEKGDRIYLRISVPEDHRARSISLTVVNPDGDKVKKPGALKVLPPKRK
jgi:aminopeptidase N